MPLTAILVEVSKTIRDNLIPAMAELADIEVVSPHLGTPQYARLGQNQTSLADVACRFGRLERLPVEE